MSLVRFARLSDAPPPARELVRVEADGRLAGWRSQAEVVGRFAGTARDIDGLRELAERAAGAPVPERRPLPPDATVDDVEAGDAELVVSANEDADGPWGDLVRACRGLLEEMVASPTAAVTLVIEGPDRIRLEHRGTEVLPIQLGSVRFDVSRWRDGAFVRSGSVGAPGLGRVEAGPGWAVEIPVSGLSGERGDLLTANAWFVADDGGVYVPVVISTSRPES